MLLLELVLQLALDPIIGVPIAKSIERAKVCHQNSRGFTLESTMSWDGVLGTDDQSHSVLRCFLRSVQTPAGKLQETGELTQITVHESTLERLP